MKQSANLSREIFHYLVQTAVKESKASHGQVLAWLTLMAAPLRGPMSLDSE